MAKATPRRSGDELAGLAASSAEERAAAQRCLADVPLQQFLDEPLIPYETDEVTRLIIDTHDRAAFAPVSGLTVGQFREWLLRYETDAAALATLAPGLTPEMAAATAKLMSNQDLILAAQKCRVVTAFRCTIGLPGRLSVRLQPNHPTDDPRGITASIIDGLLYGCGDAVIGINPATDNVDSVVKLLGLIDGLLRRYRIPTQSCVLAHVTTQLEALRRGAPVDLMFQSVAGTEAANKSFGVNLALLAEAREAALALRRGTGVDAVGTVHAPLVDGVDARGLHGEHRAGLLAQGIVQADAEQHEQMAEARRHVGRIARDVVGEHDFGGSAQAVEQVGPRTSRQKIVRGGVPRTGRLAHRVGHPGRIDERGRHGVPVGRVPTMETNRMCRPPARVGRAMLPHRQGAVKPSESPGSGHVARNVCPRRWRGVPHRAVTGRRDDT
jgi:hypothetical protein